MLKFEGVARVEQKIRAFDFQPMEGRTDRFVEGVVVAISTHQGADVFVIECTLDNVFPADNNRVGLEMYVPMEMSFDFDGRVVLVEDELANAKETILSEAAKAFDNIDKDKTVDEAFELVREALLDIVYNNT